MGLEAGLRSGKGASDTRYCKQGLFDLVLGWGMKLCLLILFLEKKRKGLDIGSVVLVSESLLLPSSNFPNKLRHFYHVHLVSLSLSVCIPALLLGGFLVGG